MRIIAGVHRSRRLKTLDGQHTRPTQDKIKEAVFSIIGPYFEGGLSLDLFAGSGSIGLESLSRGMDKCIFVDSSREAMKIIKENIQLLKEDSRAICYPMDYKKALQQCCDDHRKFDLIYIDPPYGKVSYDEILLKIDTNQLCNGILVCEGLKEDEFKNKYESFSIKKEVVYGITKLAIYKRNEDELE